MTKTTLVYSTSNYKHCKHALVYEPTVILPIEKFLLAVYENAKRARAAKRLVIKNNSYVYTPSDEWKERFIRFKFLNK